MSEFVCEDCGDEFDLARDLDEHREYWRYKGNDNLADDDDDDDDDDDAT